MSAADYDAVRRIRDHPETARWVNTIVAPDGESFARSAESARRAGKLLHLAIIDRSDLHYLGEIVLFLRAAEAAELHIGEIAYVIDPAARGRGIAPSAVRLLSAWAFERLGLQRLQLSIHPDNAPSHRVAEKASYRFEGTIRSQKVIRGVRVDSVLYSRLPTDAPPPGPEAAHR
jgi:RimJ/RimL family protein N-acetyltransferase